MLKLEGQKFGRLIAIRRLHKNNQGKYYWLFLCDCGKETSVIPYDVTSGKTQSCGCYHVQRASEANLKHGFSQIENNDEYKIWVGIRDRCNRPANSAYKYYGALGVKCCPQWNNFQNFLHDMGTRPSPIHGIDRINPYGNYEPSNCRWATPTEQNNNTRRHFDKKCAAILESL